ncbi:aspartic proteinase nepenthesin-1 [Ricinus communis]|uniref:Aspartic proteinase nepenthesin-1, putative n=1 Tax=Ricinus communis TaxID=3988 RepID=B9SA95_RICCO|nr:aspartic proteinase nepenthesin-1 [Ricinus communis]EEF39457.1 Aspartic proteinase nepenthesin-1 precursor, putative [Ricinus communis]|eukprot:XP_002522914.1 aspartic proteinase nepenthesin-1 [Ricinus communis]
MASTFSLSWVVLLSLLILSLSVYPAFSTSRRALSYPAQLKNGFRITLKHVDSDKNLTKFQRIQHGIKRANHRLERLNAMVLAASSNAEINSPVLSGNGEFLMNLAIGTPPETYSAIMDTGSDLIWTQCKPCTQCFDQPSPIFDPKKSSSFSKLSCSSQLCKALPQSSCSDSCEYLYTYGDYSSTQGTMATETFTFGKVSIPNVGFGCGEDNEGDGFTQGSGLVGLGRGPLSLVSQLKEAKFSYCLTSIDDTKTSTLLMGSLASVNGTSAAIRTTPLIQNPLQPSFYYLSLEGISVGGTRLPIKESTFQLQDDGTGGLIIDSGTTITYLEESAFDLVKKEFTSQMGLPVDNSGATGLELCYNLPSDTSELEVPKLVLHFTGADLELPGENYMIADSSMGVICLAMGSSGGMSIFGNVQQQNMFVSHDLEKETLSFLPTNCGQL